MVHYLDGISAPLNLPLVSAVGDDTGTTFVLNEFVRVYRWQAALNGGTSLVRILEGQHRDKWALAPTYKVNSVAWQTWVENPTELATLGDTMANETFFDVANRRRAIPFKYPADECWARARYMADLLTASGYAVKKVLLIYGNFVTGQSDLRVPTAYGNDLESLLEQINAVKWWYHIAPVVTMKVNSTVTEHVLDPSLSPQPLTAVQWAAIMTDAAYLAPMTYQQMQQQLLAQPVYPTQPVRAWLVSADRSVDIPPPPHDPYKVTTSAQAAVVAALTRGADLVPQRELVAALQTLMTKWLAAAKATPPMLPYNDFQSDLDVATYRRSRLSSPAAVNTFRTMFPKMLMRFYTTFSGTVVDQQTMKLLNSILQGTS
jgi:hypothetical protein